MWAVIGVSNAAPVVGDGRGGLLAAQLDAIPTGIRSEVEAVGRMATLKLYGQSVTIINDESDSPPPTPARTRGAAITEADQASTRLDQAFEHAAEQELMRRPVKERRVNDHPSLASLTPNQVRNPP